MGQYVAVRNGGKTDENGALRFLRRASNNGQGPVQTGDLLVSQHSTPNTTVDIAVGDLVIAYQDYVYYTWIDALYTTGAFTANTSGFTRIDSVVAYVDLSVVSSASNDNPGALKFAIVAGTPSGSPVAPSGSTIQSAVGAGNPYYILANVTLVNNYTTISNSNIADQRTQYLIGTNTKFGFFIQGNAAVANDQSWNPPVPATQNVTTLLAYCKTAPVGSGLTVQVYNVTKAQVVATVTIAAGANFSSTTTMTNASLSANDILRVDVTAVGGTTPGADISVILF